MTFELRILLSIFLLAISQLSCATLSARPISSYGELSVSNNGDSVGLIYRSGPKLVLVVGRIETDVAWHTVEFADRQPRSVGFSVDDKSIIVTTFPDSGSSWEIVKIPMDAIHDGNRRSALHQSTNHIYSARDLIDGSLVFMERDRVLRTGAAVLIWKRRDSRGLEYRLGDGRYPYVIHPTIIEDSGILFGYLDEKLEPYIAFVPFVDRASFPLTGASAAYRGRRIGCSRDGSACFGTHQVVRAGIAHYVHKIALFLKGLECDVPIENYWIQLIAAAR